MKVCTKCKENKSFSKFHKNKSCKDGYSYWCTMCYKDYSRNIESVIGIIYSSQKFSSKHRNMQPPTYTKQELQDWLMNDWLFNLLYNNWANCGYNKDNKPSVDRKDDYDGYTLSNIQIMTWSENTAKHHEDRKNGINNKDSRAVIQFDKIGNVVKQYYSIISAYRATGIPFASISKCCNHKYGFKSAGGFIWKYAKA